MNQALNQALPPARTGFKWASALASGLALCLLTAASVLPNSAWAQQQGYTTKQVNLRAGPSRDYPVVVTVPAGISLTVMGCVEGYRWCDVAVGSNRGWAYAGNIVNTYQGNNVPLLSYGPAIGVGIVAFSLGSYWDNYYTSYPWYPQRQNWINRPRPYNHYGPGYAPGYGSGYRPGYRPGIVRGAPPAQVRPVAPPRPPRAAFPQGHQGQPRQNPRAAHGQEYRGNPNR